MFGTMLLLMCASKFKRCNCERECWPALSVSSQDLSDGQKDERTQPYKETGRSRARCEYKTRTKGEEQTQKDESL